MDKVIMSFKDDSYYHINSASSYRLFAWALFLSGDTPVRDNFEMWAMDSKSNYQYGGNLSSLRKINGNILFYLTKDYEFFKEDSQKYSLTMSIEKFISYLQEWHRLASVGTPYIIITQKQNGEIEIFASDTNPEPVIS